MRLGAAGLAAAILFGLAVPAARAQPAGGYIVEPAGKTQIFDCAVTRGHEIRGCRTDPFFGLGRVTVGELDAHPRSVPGAKPGDRVLFSVSPDLADDGLPDPQPAADVAEALNEAQRRIYPPAARPETRAHVSCKVTDDGRLDECWTAKTAPGPNDFAGESLRLAASLRLTRLSSDRRADFDIDWRPPGPSARLIVTCRITAQATTTACEPRPDPFNPQEDEAVRQALNAHPLHLAGAPEGAALQIGLLRAELSKLHPGETLPPADPPYKVTRLPIEPEALSRYYPSRPMRMGANGRSLISCKVTDQGRFNECWVKSESPADMGFGEASLRLSQEMRAQPPGPNAPPYGARVVTIPFYWALPR